MNTIEASLYLTSHTLTTKLRIIPKVAYIYLVIYLTANFNGQRLVFAGKLVMSPKKTCLFDCIQWWSTICNRVWYVHIETIFHYFEEICTQLLRKNLKNTFKLPNIYHGVGERIHVGECFWL